MKLKVGKKIIPIFEKSQKKPNKPNFYQQGNNKPRPGIPGQKGVIRPQPNFKRPSPSFSARPVTGPQSSLMRGISGSPKKEKQSMTKTLSKLPSDELAAYTSIIVGIILIFIAIIIW
jgi:hypothetical protein